MPHILRIDNDPNISQQNHQDWTGSHNGLTGDRINHIPDTFSGAAGNVAGSAAKAGTSIPSPFARLYLFDTAFRMVNADIMARELTMYHILVSHCLDMLELLFQAGNSPDLTYRVWNREERLGVLNSKTPTTGAGGLAVRHSHQILAKALELDMRNELASLQQFTLIYYKGALLGGTSPLTLVFTSPNWEQERQNKYIDPPKSTTGRLFFQNEYVPLQQRDEGFVTYLRRLYDQYGTSMLRGGLKDYLYKVYFDGPVALPVAPDTTLANFDPIQIGGDGNSVLQVVPGLALYKVREADVLSDIEAGSDFVMQPTVLLYQREARNGAETGVPKPLALASRMDVSGRYVKNTNWSPQTVIMRSTLNNLSEGGLLADRFLPGVDNVRYPFVTTEDFLEDFLVKMPFKINSQRFFTGMAGDCEYLLPIRKAYFNFFRFDDLQKQLSLYSDGNTLTATLRIPIRNSRTVEFKKQYNLNEEQTTLNFRAGFAFFPFYKITAPDPYLQKLNQYSVMLADLSDDNANFRAADSIRFYQTTQRVANQWLPLSVPTPEARSPKANSPATYFYKVSDPFDFVEVKLDSRGIPYRGLMLPKFTVIAQKGFKPFTFAVDFGTSNTHVAYTDTATGNIDPVSLTVSDGIVQLDQDELQMVTLNKPYDGYEVQNTYDRYRLPVSYGSIPQLDSLIRREFVPAILGKEFGSPFTFPLRTAVYEKIGMSDSVGGDNLFSKLNLGFNIDLEESPTGVNRYVTNLKWLFENQPGDSLNRPRVRAFFETLLLLIRNKVILNQGNMQETRIVWLAPSSMRAQTEDNLIDEWKKAALRVFNTTAYFTEKPISESLAPYFYLIKKNVRPFADTVNMDIGGGTADLMLFMKGQNRYLNTSFRFAGYDIWGGGLNDQGHPAHTKDNGFVKNYINFKRSLSQTPAREDNIFEAFLHDRDLTAEDVVSLLFKYNDHFKFEQSIKDGKPALRIVLYLHYSALVYHLVQLIEAHGLSLPRYLTFTGRGSQYLNMLGSRSRLVEFTKLLFRSYTTLPIPPDFEVVLTDNPKETTANGAVLYETSVTDKAQYENRETSPYWGNEADKPVDFVYRRTKVGDVRQRQEFHDSVLLNMKNFLAKTLKDPDIAYFMSQYNITTPEKYYDLLVGSDVTRGGWLYDSYMLARMAMEQNPNEAVAETFFFLPLKHSLYELSKYIAES